MQNVHGSEGLRPGDILDRPGRTGMANSRRALTTAFLFTAMLWSVNVIWLLMDSRPPAWDMAMHQTYALNYYPSTGLAAQPLPLWKLSGNYPPFVHIAIAFLYWLFHPGAHVAAMVNLPATFLLFWALYALATELASERTALWTCTLTALTPLMIWLSRETILDYWLCAWVAVSLVALRRTHGFASHRASLLFGCTLGMGLLTKWLFAGFLVAPIAFVCIQARIWRESRRVLHLADALIVGEGIAAVWYLPNLSALTGYFFENARIGMREGEPPIFSFQSFIYYLRLLEGYQLFGLLFAVLVVGIITISARKMLRDEAFLHLTIAGGWLAMTLLRTKDPRFTMPLLGLLLIFPARWLECLNGGRAARLFKGVLVTLLAVQAYAINFGIPWLPQRVIIAEGYQGSRRWDWNLYLQEFYGIFGRPRREDWKQDVIFKRILCQNPHPEAPVRLAVLPDLPHFNSETLLWRAHLLGLPILAGHPQSSARGMRAFDDFDFILMTEGNQGEGWSTRENGALNRTIVDNPGTFRVLELYLLPNGDYVRLYSVSRVAAKIAANVHTRPVRKSQSRRALDKESLIRRPTCADSREVPFHSSNRVAAAGGLRPLPASGFPGEHLNHPMQRGEIKGDELGISQIPGYCPETSERQIEVKVGFNAQPHQPPAAERSRPEMRSIVIGVLGAHFDGLATHPQLSGELGSRVWCRKGEKRHIQIACAARVLNRLLNLGWTFVREADHEESLGAHLVALGNGEEPIYIGDAEMLPRRVLIALACTLDADTHGVNSCSSHQLHEAVVHELGPKAVGKREPGLEA